MHRFERCDRPHNDPMVRGKAPPRQTVPLGALGTEALTEREITRLDRQFDPLALDEM